MTLFLILFILPASSLATDNFTPKEFSTSINNDGHLRLLVFPGIVERLVQQDKVLVQVFHQISNYSAPIRLRLRSSSAEVIAIEGLSNFTLTKDDSRSWSSTKNSNVSEWGNIRNSSAGMNVTLVGVFLGRASIVFEVANETSGEWTMMKSSLKVSVIRRLRWIDKIFTGIVVCLVMFANLGMGTKLELTVVKQVLRRPLAPLIGFISQYTVMPLVAFGVGSLIKLPAGILLGYFAMGCAPGGGASNFYSYLLGGDVSLSITMTLVSTVAALGMVPFWLFTLGQYIIKNQEHSVTIPFQNILISLFTMLVPVAFGYLIKLKLPRVANVINKAIKPFIICLIIFFFTVGIYANLYIFRLFSPIVVLAGCLLPYCGFIFGGLIAFMARLKIPFVKTVSIETGIQNTGVPILLMKFSLPQPDSDISIVGPIAASMFTPLPLMIAVFVLEIYRRCFKKKTTDADDKDAEGEQANTSDVNANEVEIALLERGNDKENNETEELGEFEIEINGRKGIEPFAKEEEGI